MTIQRMPVRSEPLLMLELLAWVDTRPRSYGETIEAWRTSCPRLPVWEEAVENGLLRVVHDPGVPMTAAPVRLTRLGRTTLQARRLAR